MPFELPLAQSESAPLERADAAANRRRILRVASTLFAERGIEHVTMHDVARAAAVGPGTIYRRFGDRAGLALALLDECERAFQDELLHGAPPLGPGAAPAARLEAFGRSYLALLEGHGELILAAESGGPVVGGPFSVYRTHLLVLLRELAPEGTDVEALVEPLLAAISARRHRHLRLDRGWPLARLQDGWSTLTRALAVGLVAQCPPRDAPRSPVGAEDELGSQAQVGARPSRGDRVGP